MPAVLHVEDVWRPDRGAGAEAVFGTADREHPGYVSVEPAGPAGVRTAPGKRSSFRRECPCRGAAAAFLTHGKRF